MKSIYLQKDKTIFDLSEYPAEAFATSLGLPGAPQIKFGAGPGQGKDKKRGGEAAAKAEVAVEEAVKVAERGVVGSDDESDEDENVEGDDDDDDDDDDVESGDQVSEGSEDKSGSGSESDSEDKPIVSHSLQDTGNVVLIIKSKTPAVRTKYDRMFERKNQSILAPHYSALVSHDPEAEDDDEVFTLARKDHDIPLGETSDLEETPSGSHVDANGALISAEDMSKRKLKAATSKKALLKSRPAPDKLIFDEVTGEARNFYESGADVENLAGGLESRAKFLEEERERMREAHKVDREVAREKKREKKRKRQERERERMKEGSGDEGSEDEGGAVAVIGGAYSDDDNEFEGGRNSDGSEDDEEEDDRPRGKKTKTSSSASKADNLEDEEALALRLLQGS